MSSAILSIPVDVVANSTPLMHLSAMRQLDLLQEMFGRILIPEEVYDEVVVRGTGRPGAAEVAADGWIVRRAVSDALAMSILTSSLGTGEAAAIALAREVSADLLVMDDRPGRVMAEAQGLAVTGTVGVLIAAGERGLLSFPDALDRLLLTGFRLHPKECARTLASWRERHPG